MCPLTSLQRLQVLAGVALVLGAPPSVVRLNAQVSNGVIVCYDFFTVISSPNPSLKHAVIGVLPVHHRRKLTPSMAAGLAKAIPRQFEERWLQYHIFVFEDKKRAEAFGKYQYHVSRRSAPLTAPDFIALRTLWPHTLAFYEFKQGRERVLYPQRALQTWWWPLVSPKQ